MKKDLPACPVETTLMLISDRWKVLIIRDLLQGTRRFGELKKSVGNISQKVLTANLRSHGGGWTADKKGFPRGAAARGVYADRNWLQLKAHS